MAVSRDVVHARVRAGRWHRVHHGVYAIGHRRRDPNARYMAAVLACGPGAVLSHRSAAAVWRIRPHHNGPAHVTTTRKLKRRDDIHVHWTRTDPQPRTRDGIPLTSLTRTLQDLEGDERELATQAAERIHGYERTTPFRSTQRGELERRFINALREAGLPEPLMNVPHGPYVLDAYWPAYDLVLEIDDFATHRTHAAFRADRERDRVLLAHGLRTARITAQELAPRALHRALASLLRLP